MNTYNLKSIFTLMVLILYMGCTDTFEPSGTYHVDVTPPAGDISATIELTSSDPSATALIEDRTSFFFEATVEDRTIYESRAYLDDTLIYSDHGHQGQFTIDPNLVADGPHTLRLDVYTNAGTGSLADKLGSEGYILYGEWPIQTMGDEPIEFPSITSTYPDSGKLRVNWTKSQRFKFEQYQLGTGYTTEDIDDTTYLASHYIGGEHDYRVAVTIAGVRYDGYQYTTPHPLPHIHTYDMVGPTSMLLKWSPCAFYANFESYWAYVPYEDPVIKYDINDTTYLWEDIPFGKAFDFRLFTSNNSESNGHNGTSHSIPLYIGDSTGVRFDAAGYNSEQDRLVYSIEDTLKRADGSSLEVLNSTILSSQLQCVISPQAEHIVGYNNNVLTIFDAVTLEAGETLNLAEIIRWDIDIYSLVLSETGLAIFVARISKVTTDDYVVAIDLNTGRLVDTMLLPSNVYYPLALKCSTDGEYVAFNYTMMRLENQAFSTIHEGDYARYISFVSEPQRVIISTPTRLKMLELPSLTQIRNVSAPSRGSLSLDESGGYLGAYNADHQRFIVFNLENLIPMTDFPASEADYILFNSRILSSNGFSRPVVD